jgi:AraC-like DNA-binding protein
MSTFPWLAACIVALAWLSMLSLVLRRNRSQAETWFALFCGSLAMSQLRPEVMQQSAWLVAVISVLSSATCNVYWLFARSLFRTREAVKLQHVAVAFLVAALIVLLRWAQSLDPSGQRAATVVLDAIVTLAGSAMLVLTFSEALRGWSQSSPGERRLRLSFMLMFGSCVLVASIASALAEHNAAWQGAHQIAIACCVLLVLVYSHIVLHIRRTQGLAAMTADQPSAHTHLGEAKLACSEDEQALAKAIIAQLEQGQLFREAQLKVADLALHLHVAEHKISRAITQVLGERNFNQLINRYRIAYACEQLLANAARPVIDISADSGFASLGPFNRAFKAAMACTPSEYRARACALQRLC